MQPIRMKDLKKVNPFRACEYYNSCFKDPSTFTLVIVGNIDPALAQPLILQYLVSGILRGSFFGKLKQLIHYDIWCTICLQGGIPRPLEPILHFNRDDLKGLPFTFPTSIIR